MLISREAGHWQSRNNGVLCHQFIAWAAASISFALWDWLLVLWLLGTWAIRKTLRSSCAPQYIMPSTFFSRQWIKTGNPIFQKVVHNPPPFFLPPPLSAIPKKKSRGIFTLLIVFPTLVNFRLDVHVFVQYSGTFDDSSHLVLQCRW